MEGNGEASEGLGGGGGKQWVKSELSVPATVASEDHPGFFASPLGFTDFMGCHSQW